MAKEGEDAAFEFTAVPSLASVPETRDEKTTFPVAVAE